MSEFSLLNASEVDRAQLDAFLHVVYRPEKADFLSQHADWWYRSGSRFVVVENATGRIAGHSATIGGSILYKGEIVPMQWWVDLVVHPDFRGKGLQTTLDDAIRGTDRLKFAYPARDLSAKMFVKHGWQRHDNSYRYEVKLSVLAIERLNRSGGRKGSLARFGARLTLPLEWGWRKLLARYRPQTARQFQPNAAQLAAIFRQYQANSPVLMTNRDEAYLRWRYFESPYHWRFYAAGDADAPSLVMIVRMLVVNGIKTARIVDVFGDFSNGAAIQDVLRLIKADCAREGIQRIVTIAGLPELTSALQATGFGLNDTLIFCWHTDEARYDDWLNSAPQHWTYADSDCDA